MLFGLALTAASGLHGVPAAAADTHLDGSIPADGARLNRPPDVVALTFDDPLSVTIAILALGARQRHTLARRSRTVAGAALVSTARIEMLLGLLVLATTALLAGEAARG